MNGRNLLITLIPMMLGFFRCLTVWADPFVDAVTAFNPGAGAGFGQDEFPAIVLGPPAGAGASAGSLDVLSLGDGGVIVLEFVDNVATNGPGPDLIIFENAFYAGGDPENVFSEVAFVEVSQDGTEFHRFPNDYDPEGTPVNNPANWHGFAGVGPVFSHPDNSIDPTDPDTAGGDLFDLDDVGLQWIRYLRIIDTGEGDAAATDDDGDIIYDPGFPGGTVAGFDLDAVAAVYSEPVPTPTPPGEPTASPSPSITPTPDPSPSPTSPVDYTFNLSLSKELFAAGDEFLLEVSCTNPWQALEGLSLYIILDVYGTYYFCPSWTTEADRTEIDLPPGLSGMTILQFTWPAVSGHADNLIVWGGIVTPENMVLGSVDRVVFGY